MRMSSRGVTLVVAMVAVLAVGCGGGDGDDDDDDDTPPPSDAATPDAPEPIADAAVPDATPPGDAMVPLDPAPGIETPGEHGGMDCPDSDQTTFVVDVGATTSFSLSGTVTGNVGDGLFYVRGPNGETVSGALETDGAGAFAKTVPLFCGLNTVKLVWNNASCPLVVVFEVTRSSCTPADIVITLQWDALGDDWELHLIKPGGRINDDLTDCTWTSCIGVGPDWGVVGDTSDDPLKDIDDTDAYGPENIFLSGPEPGTYTVMVEHWAQGDPGSDGSVTINVGDTSVVAQRFDLVYQHVWTAATIEWPSGVVTLMQGDYDCSASWSGGCTADIP